MIPPYVFIAGGLALLFAVACLLVWALCVTASEADRQLDDEHGGLRLDEAMLLTWDEICNLPEVRP